MTGGVDLPPKMAFRVHRTQVIEVRCKLHLAAKNLVTDLCRGIVRRSKSRPYSRSCAGHQLGAHKQTWVNRLSLLSAPKDRDSEQRQTPCQKRPS
jgi:hypothetical protein